MTARRVQKATARSLALLFASALFSMFLPVDTATAQTASAGARIGVYVEQAPPTTLAPTPTTATPKPSVPTTTPPPTSVPSTTVPKATNDSLADELPAPDTDAPQTLFDRAVGGVKSTVKTTKELVKGVASGKPVADVAEAVLPHDVATVVVPAVRTASTFVFPIGLAGAVVAFLALQQRIDAGDPKLTAAPLAHDDDVVTFS